MSITPKALARLLGRAADRRANIETVSEPRMNDRGHASFDVEDDEGGILQITIVQYKEPIR